MELESDVHQSLGGSHRRFASVGDVIKVAIKDALPKAKVKKGKYIMQ